MTTNTSRHEAPDVAELRILAVAATPGPWWHEWVYGDDWWAVYGQPTGDMVCPEVCTMWSSDESAYIAAANPAVMLGLLDRLAHMTEARDAARAEVERLTALVAETNEPHPDRPTCTIVGGKGVRVTATDLETGKSESVVIDNDYVLICAGDRYQSEVQRHANGTTVLTVKVRKHLDALDGEVE